MVTPLKSADMFLVVLALAGVVVLAVRSQNLVLTRERNQVRWLLWGFAIGAAPYVFLRTLPTLLGASPLLPTYVDRVAELAIPLSFVLVVVRHQFLDIDVIIRRSLLYGCLAAVVVVVYVAAGLVFGRWLGSLRPLAPWLPPLVVGLIAGVLFQPLRRTLGGWIDRTFFKLAHDQDAVLAALAEATAEIADHDGLARELRGAIDATLRPVGSGVVLDDPTEPDVRGNLPAASVRRGLAWIRPDASGGGRVRAAPRSTSLPEIERDDFPAGLIAAGVLIVQPLTVHDEVRGAILLGPRETGRRYIEQDLTFLTGCAQLAAQGLERIDLLRSLAEEAAARHQLAELNRLKSDFLSRVAHDLRTPVAGITWSARNLRDGIAGELAPRQIEYVRSIEQAGSHLNRLVDNLLEISRLERTEQSLELAAVDPREVWETAAETLRPLAESKDAVLRLRGGEPAVAVRANRDKLVEVAVNLLDNAIKYTAPGSAVEVTLHEPEQGQLPVSVRDHGPGLGDQQAAGLFARYAQGSPSPHSSRQGFGLGLYIVASYLELMGGSIDAADREDGGAEFVCRLAVQTT
jgi:signal transduction histidine kinase